MGSVGEVYYARLTGWITPQLMLGLELDRTLIGSTTYLVTAGKVFPRERRIGAQVDVSYRFWGEYSLLAAYELMHVRDRNFTKGDTGLDHLIRLELTRSFR